MKQKAKWFFIAIGLCLIFIGLMLLLEGGFRISIKSLSEIKDEIEHSSQQKVLNTAEKDNALVLYCSGKNKNEDVIYEVIKNPITSKYSIADRNIADKHEKNFFSVLESSIFVYGYEVDLSTGSISIYERSLSNNLYISIIFILLGMIMILYQIRRR